MTDDGIVPPSTGDEVVAMAQRQVIGMRAPSRWERARTSQGLPPQDRMAGDNRHIPVFLVHRPVEDHLHGVTPGAGVTA
jgi:hypothetical protein